MRESIAQLKSRRKKKQVTIHTKTLVYVIFQISILSMILLVPVFFRSLHMSILLALCTLFLFGGMLVYLGIRLVMIISDWLGSGKHTQRRNGEQTQPKGLSLGGLLDRVLTMGAWGIILKLWSPFIVTMIWWQGYKLMEGKAFSLMEIKTTALMVEYMTYFGMGVFLLLVSQPYWRCHPKVRPGEQELTTPFPTGVLGLPYAKHVEASQPKKTAFASAGK